MNYLLWVVFLIVLIDSLRLFATWNIIPPKFPTSATWNMIICIMLPCYGEVYVDLFWSHGQMQEWMLGDLTPSFFSPSFSIFFLSLPSFSLFSLSFNSMESRQMGLSPPRWIHPCLKWKFVWIGLPWSSQNRITQCTLALAWLHLN